MSTLDFKVIDLDFPVGSKNKTATLITGEEQAFLIDAGFTRADGHRLAAEILDSGKNLTKVFISHADPATTGAPRSSATPSPTPRSSRRHW